MGVRGHMVQCLLPGRPWARLEMVLPCPHCGVEFTPRPEAIESAAHCPSCQQPTVIEPAWWDEAVHLAHAVVDLAHPDFHHQNEALGAFNPFGDVGLSQPCASLPSDRIPMQSMLRLRVGPGAPPCLRCGTPLVVRVLTQGRQTTECPQCGDREAFALPLSLVGRVPAIRALIGFGPETAAAQGRIEPWWLLMEGPSTLRPLVQAQMEQSQKDAAPRKDDLTPRVSNSGEGLAYVKLSNGVEIVAVNSGFSLYFVKDAAVEIREINCDKHGSQFRSRDIFPPAFGLIAHGDYSKLGDDIRAHVPDYPKNAVCYTDGYGNMKCSVDPKDLAAINNKYVTLDINGR